MRTFYLRAFALTVAAFLAIAGTAASQDRPGGLLSSLEVKQLVARAEPADNARLSAHFSALADQFTAEAKRHTAMSQNFFLTLAKRYTKEVNEHVALAQSYRGTKIAQAAVHHDRLASLARDSAKESKAAAEMHKQLANIAG